MEDLDKKIIELMDLFDGEVTTLDKINPPESRKDVQDIEAINRFMRDNPPGKADGGRIGFKKKGFVNKAGQAGGDAEFQRKLQLAYDEYGQEALDKGAKVLGFKDYASMGGAKNLNFRKKIKDEITRFGEVLPAEESRKRSRQARIPKEQGIQIKLLNELNTKKFFDPKAFAKENNISMKELKTNAMRLRNNIYDKRMLVSGKNMQKSTLTWIPDDLQAADNALNKMWKSKLIVNDRTKIENLFYNAFGNPRSPTFNPKKHLAIRKKLNEYYQLNAAIKEKYPNLTFELDHPLSKSSLNKIFNATADQLVFVNPLTRDLNRGFKDSLSLQYERSVQNNDLKKKKAVEKIARDLNLNIGKISDDATNFKYGVKEFQKLNIKDEIGKSLQNLSALNKNFQTYAKNNPELFKTAGVSTQQTFTKIDNVKGLVPFMKKLGIKCQLSEGINCMNPKAYERSLNQISKAAKAGDTAAASKMANFTKAVRGAGSVIKGVLGPAALAYEVAFAVPIGLFEYAQGKPAEEIVNTLTYGLGGKSREDRLKEEMPTYGQGDALQSAFDGYLSTLNRLGEERDPNQLRPGKKADDMLKTFYERQEPFMRVNPQVEQGQMFDLDMFRKNVAESRAAEEKLAEEDLKRKQERRTDPFTAYSDDFMAAGGGRAGFTGGGYGKDAAKYIKEIETDHHKGYQYYKKHGGKKSFKQYMKESMSKYFAGGGIAKEAGDPSGAPPESGPNSQGLQGLLNRVKNT